jgi:hypothetical protein
MNNDAIDNNIVSIESSRGVVILPDDHVFQYMKFNRLLVGCDFELGVKRRKGKDRSKIKKTPKRKMEIVKIKMSNRKSRK